MRLDFEYTTKSHVMTPSRFFIWMLIATAVMALAALVLGAPVHTVGIVLSILAMGIAAFVVADIVWTRRAWQHAPLKGERHMSAAFALGVPSDVRLVFHNHTGPQWRIRVFDHADPTLILEGLPLQTVVAQNQQVDARYRVTPTHRGVVSFGLIELRVHSRLRLMELRRFVGAPHSVHVYPNFAAVARYAWLAGDRRLLELGVKAYIMRGEGTDFKELSDYRPGESLRHIDWKATLKQQRPIVRTFQDDRDQNVIFLLDCGRRMRAHEGIEHTSDQMGGLVLSHFDHALDAVMLLSYVALKAGDAVGAMTFGHTAPTQAAMAAPRKGMATFNALMAQLGAIQPQAVFSDYMQAARDLMAHVRKRSLVVLITNFRDEDAAELEPALRVLRSRHLVIVASIREAVVQSLTDASLNPADSRSAFDVAAAHLYEQSRRDAFSRLAARDALLVDAAPKALPIELVNRYHAVKRTGLL